MKRPRLVPLFRSSIRAASFGLLTTAMLGGVEAHQRLASPDKRPLVFDRHMRAWCRTLLRLFGVHLAVQPPSAPHQHRLARMVVSNHRSPLDVAILLALFGGRVLSRDDLKDWPILGTAASKAGTIFVDRNLSSSGAAAIRSIRKALREGSTIIVFPEGTTFEGDDVRPFHMGAFVGAQSIDLEIVPVGLAYDPGCEFVDETFVQHLGRMAARRETRVGIRIGTAFRAEGRAAQVGERARHEVQTLVHEARRLLANQ